MQNNDGIKRFRRSSYSAKKKEIAEYITRNLYSYTWYKNIINGSIDAKIDLDLTKSELREEVFKSPYAQDFQIISKYLK